MIKRKISPGLSIKLSLGALLSLAVALFAFYSLVYLGNGLVDRMVYDNGFAEKLVYRAVERIQSAIDEADVALADVEDFWEKYDRGSVYYLLLLQDDIVIYDSTGLCTGLNAEYALSEDDYPCTLHFSDADVMAVLYGDFASAYYRLSLALSAVVALLLFALIYTLLVRRRLKYVVQLEREMRVLEGGDLHHEVPVVGRDELGQLAASINDMRVATLNRQTGEERALHAGRELVASMSHDLRTPLTSLIGYLELLVSGKVQADAEQRLHFSQSALSKAYRIKSMSDELFEYALGELQDEEDFTGEVLDADLFVRQVLDEQRFNVEQDGFRVLIDGEAHARICAEPDRLIRVFDNLFSNMRKYADPAGPLCFHWEVRGGRFCMEVKNHLRPDLTDNPRSTGLGLKNCENILLRHGGEFSARAEDGWFIVRLSLPTLENAQGGNSFAPKD